MYCPNCKSEVNCGCKSCMIHSPDKPNKLIKNGENETCTVCGFTTSTEEWADIEYEQYVEGKNK